MGGADARQDAYCGTDDAFQPVHLPHLAYASLNESYVRRGVYLPHAERHSDLRIEATWRARHAVHVVEHLVEPLLDHRLAIAARDAHHRHVEVRTMPRCQILQGRQRVADDEKPCFRTCAPQLLAVCHDEGAHSLIVQTAYVVVAVGMRCDEGKKQRLLGHRQRAAVGEQSRDPGLRRGRGEPSATQLRSDDFGYLRQIV